MKQEILDRVLQSPRLPSLPTVALDVIALAQTPDVNFGRVAEVIQQDPALSGKMLQIVNSALYGQTREIGTVSRALQVLGLSTTKTLALGFSLVSNLQQSRKAGLDHVSYWRRSLYTGAAAQTISRRAGVAQHEEAFLGGLLQDIGMVAMSQALGAEYLAVVQKAGTRHAALRAFEMSAFEVDHAEVGAAMAETWGLPRVLVAPIRHHEDLYTAEDDLKGVVRSVALGNTVAEIFLSDDAQGPALDQYYTRATVWFDIARADAERLLTQVHDATTAMSRLFDLPTGNLGQPEEILARANDALVQFTLQSQQQNSALLVEVSTDALTGVLNRRAFDHCLREQFGVATAQRPVSLVFVDIDHFKRFNDRHGHAMGDRVLLAFSTTLQRATAADGTVFRCGGEEFGIVCPNADKASATAIAEAARAAVEADLQLTADDGAALQVTCSLGVATHTGATFDDVTHFLRAADESLYDAKEAGRNCVRSHTTPDEVATAGTFAPGCRSNVTAPS